MHVKCFQEVVEDQKFLSRLQHYKILKLSLKMYHQHQNVSKIKLWDFKIFVDKIFNIYGVSHNAKILNTCCLPDNAWCYALDLEGTATNVKATLQLQCQNPFPTNLGEK